MPRHVAITDAVVNLGSLTCCCRGCATGNGVLSPDGMHEPASRALPLGSDPKWGRAVHAAAAGEWRLGVL